MRCYDENYFNYWIDPFGGEPINPAWEAVKTMDGYTDGDYKVVTQMVPTVRYTSVDTVKAAAEKCQPDFILCVGQAGGRPDITVERVAINCDDFRIPDNAGNQPEDEPIVADGPSAYFATLPIKNIVNALHQASIPAKFLIRLVRLYAIIDVWCVPLCGTKGQYQGWFYAHSIFAISSGG